MCVLFLRRIGANGVNGMMFQSCDLRKFIVYRPASDTRGWIHDFLLLVAYSSTVIAVTLHSVSSCSFSWSWS
jgi:hypothetical protein